MRQTTSERGAASIAALTLTAANDDSAPALTAAGGRTITHAELRRAAREIAAGLAHLGVEPGDRVAILAGTRPEWTLADLGALCAGAVVVPIYHTNSPAECRYILEHAGVRVIFAEDAAQLAKLDGFREQLPQLESAIVLAGEADGAVTLAELRSHGELDRTAEVAADDVATIIYTSGTTGPPKGCVVTHAALRATVDMYTRRLELDSGPLSVYLFLPLAHSLARVTELAVIGAGGTLQFWGGDPARIVDELAELHPTHFPAVPRIYEKIHSRVLSQVAAQGRLRRGAFRWALAEGARFRAAARRGTEPGRLLRLRHSAADRLVLSRVRSVFGDRLVFAMCGAAPVSREVLEFFDACGVLILEGYGMTETTAAATLNTAGSFRFGTVGRPLPGTEVSIADDGEVLMRGPHIFRGYFKNDEATHDTITDDGWLHSGDLGSIDEDGYLRITGRKKELLITSSGKNISAANIETALREIRWVSQAVVYGDNRSYLVALLTLDPEEVSALAARAGVEPEPATVAGDERVRAEIGREVEKINERFARIEQVKRFAILDRDLTQDRGELTPTMKVKRAVVYREFAEVFDSLYQ
jgi:long-chain acyl-CoA synthetase